MYLAQLCEQNGRPSKRARQRDHRVSKSEVEYLEQLENNIHLWPVREPEPESESDFAASSSSSMSPSCEEVACDFDSIATRPHPTMNLPGDASAPSARGHMSRGNAQAVYQVSVDNL